MLKLTRRFLLCAIICTLFTQARSQQTTPSLDHILNKDGTIKPGVEGSFNATGYNIEFAPDGSPVFKQGRMMNCNEWASQFSFGAADGSVNAIAVNGTNVYIGGDFLNAGGVRTPRIARWDGTSWTALSNLTIGSVYALAVMNGNLYAAGTLDQ